MAATVPPLSAGTDRRVGSGSQSIVRTERTRTVVVLRGEWDFSTRAALADVLSRVIASGSGDVVIDLAEADFIDTATVRAFVDAQHFLYRSGRRLTFRSPPKVALRVLDLFGLTDLIDDPDAV